MAIKKQFLSYVIPSVLAFALSGVYSIVDGFFVGNSIGNAGLSAINIAYPVTAIIHAIGTGLGMGGAVYFSIYMAGNKEKRAKAFVAGTLWLLLVASVIVTSTLLITHTSILEAFGAKGDLLTYGKEYLRIICIGATFQIFSTGLLPLIRNNGGASLAMLIMMTGFCTNIVLDYLFIWVYAWGMSGAALATVIGEAVAVTGAICFLIYKKQFSFKLQLISLGRVFKDIIKIGIAPFGITMTPNLSLIFINKFSSGLGGAEAIAVYACISYILSIVYLVLQGVADGSQPLISHYYGAKNYKNMFKIRSFAYIFALILSFVSILIIFRSRWQIGEFFGASDVVINEVALIFPIFLVSIPFIAINRITTDSFFAIEKNIFSYILTFSEPIIMLALLLILTFFGGQIMVWWSAALTPIIVSLIALTLKFIVDTEQKPLTLASQ